MRGIILYEDDLRVAVLTLRSSNTKTGNMAQAWILARNVNPFSATITGQDEVVCGDCKHKFTNGGTCYVNVARAPTIVWSSYHRGLYKPMTPKTLKHADGVKVRLGAYGDPAFVPFEVWAKLLSIAGTHTGYTHQWRKCDPRFKSIVMASVDSMAERQEAESAGWRTFRIRAAGERRAAGEMQCPAAEEVGHRAQCFTCRKCSGGTGVSVSIDVHGRQKKRFLPMMASVSVSA